MRDDDRLAAALSQLSDSAQADAAREFAAAVCFIATLFILPFAAWVATLLIHT